VLEALASSPAKGSLPELMSRTGFDRATVNRILRSFIDAGYVERRSRGDYGISNRGYVLGVRLTHANHLIQVAEPELRALRESTQETVNLAALEGTQIVYLARFPVGRIISLGLEIGSRLPAFSASLGRAILAYLPQDEILTILRNTDRQSLTPHTKTSIPDLVAALEQVRRRGFALVNQEFELGLCSMACPIFLHTGRPVAAVNIPIPTARLSPTELAQRHSAALKAACNRISRALGYTGGQDPPRRAESERRRPITEKTR
jgi:IclR family pca regulon transcriptional regulator